MEVSGDGAEWDDEESKVKLTKLESGEETDKPIFFKVAVEGTENTDFESQTLDQERPTELNQTINEQSYEIKLTPNAPTDETKMGKYKPASLKFSIISE